MCDKHVKSHTTALSSSLWKVQWNSPFWAHSILNYYFLDPVYGAAGFYLRPHGRIWYMGADPTWQLDFHQAPKTSAWESILLYYTTSFIHSTAEILAPKVQSANRRSPPPLGDPCFLPDTCSIVDIFHDHIFATTTDYGQPRWSTLLLLALMQTSFILHEVYY